MPPRPAPPCLDSVCSEDGAQVLTAVRQASYRPSISPQILQPGRMSKAEAAAQEAQEPETENKISFYQDLLLLDKPETSAGIATLAEDLNSFLGNHMEAYNDL